MAKLMNKYKATIVSPRTDARTPVIYPAYSREQFESYIKRTYGYNVSIRDVSEYIPCSRCHGYFLKSELRKADDEHQFCEDCDLEEKYEFSLKGDI
jgi:hypothetical protein